MLDPTKEKLLTTTQAAKLLGVHRSTVEGWYRAGLLEWVIVGRRRYTSTDAITRMVQIRTEAAGAPTFYPESKRERDKRHAASVRKCEEIFGCPCKGS